MKRIRSKKYVFVLVAVTAFMSGLFSVTNNAQTGSITIYLAGDSTMAEKRDEKRPETGWGEMLQKHFYGKDLKIDNRAMNGRSTRTFISEGRWDQLVNDLNPNDIVLIQFGHNDQSKEKVDRYTPPEDFVKNLKRFVAEVRQKKGVPVLFTPVVRRRFDKDGKFYDVHGEYPGLTKRAAAETGAFLIDMHASSERLLTELGADESRKLFLQLKPSEHENYPDGIEDNTHFSPFGADEMAELALQQLLEIDLGLRKYLKSRP